MDRNPCRSPCSSGGRFCTKGKVETPIDALESMAYPNWVSTLTRPTYEYAERVRYILAWVHGPHNWHPLSGHSMSTVDASANANANTGKPRPPWHQQHHLTHTHAQDHYTLVVTMGALQIEKGL
ncbi:hypothetical protein Landi51_02302 [Colletotrichum acutatum]